MKRLALMVVMAGIFSFQSAFAQQEFTADSVKSICKRVAKGRLKATLSAGWQNATYFEGVMALHDMTKDKETTYLDSTVAWGVYNKWLGGGGETLPTNFDNSCCFQAYLDSYLADPKPANLPHIQNALNFVKNYTYTTCPNTCGKASWPIVDMYHMAAPSHPRAGIVLNDKVIFDSISHYAVQNALRHYNVKFHLFNSNCSDTNTTRQWWGRGCGWGVCATCRIHQYLPAGHPGRAWCEARIRETCAKLLTLQNQTDGMWRSELFTPDWKKEASGSSFFCYELFYAIRNRIVDTATYLAPAKKAWKGLVGCVGADPKNPNLPGWSQGVGGGPSNTFDSTNHDAYTEGAFLMAGNEIYKFITAGLVTGSGHAAPRAARPQPAGPAVFSAFPVNIRQRIAVPEGAKGIEYFALSGRKIGDYRLTDAQQSVVLPDKIAGSGVVLGRFIFRN
jgi:unsaturated rhamnogalacturonyl hydrolase